MVLYVQPARTDDGPDGGCCCTAPRPNRTRYRTPPTARGARTFLYRHYATAAVGFRLIFYFLFFFKLINHVHITDDGPPQTIYNNTIMFSCILDITQWMAVIDGCRRSRVEMTNHTTKQYSGISEFLTSGTPWIKNLYINPKLALTCSSISTIISWNAAI